MTPGTRPCQATGAPALGYGRRGCWAERRAGGGRGEWAATEQQGKLGHVSQHQPVLLRCLPCLCLARSSHQGGAGWALHALSRVGGERGARSVGTLSCLPPSFPF